MIGWLQGQIAEPWQQANRCGVLLVCQGVGYEVQLSLRHWRDLPAQGSDLTLHVHHSVRDDGWTLFGFAARHERDLFRELVAVSGVGPQMALALLGTHATDELVRAIVHGDLRSLTQAPGVGKRTAERLSVELRQRLQERFRGVVDTLPLDDLDLAGGDGAGTPPGGTAARRCRSPWRRWATNRWRSIEPCGPWPPRGWGPAQTPTTGSVTACGGCPARRPEGGRGGWAFHKG